jgi:hypothetical protein
MRSIAKIIAGAIALLLSFWAGAKAVLDLIGRALVAQDFADPNGLAAKGLIWLFATPWWVPGALASLIVIVLAILLVRLERHRYFVAPAVAAKPSAFPPERVEYRNEVVRITDLVHGGTSLISGKTFDKCLIVGPAFLHLHTRNNVEFCSCIDRNLLFLIVNEGTQIRQIRGSIVVNLTTFRECYFADNVSVIGTSGDTKTLRDGFDAMSLEQWWLRYPLPT